MDLFVDTTSSECKPVKILMIGNGFDLAHDLPTSYIDFLNFSALIQAFAEDDMSMYDWKNLYLLPKLFKIQKEINSYCREYIEKYIKKRANIYIVEKLIDNIENNMWFKVFENDKIKTGENWIDFEKAILMYIKKFEKKYQDVIKMEFSFEALIYFLKTYKSILPLIYKKRFKIYKENMLNDLNRLIKAFEIYLSECVEKTNITKISPDILNQKFNYMISFNYTTTFARVYEKNYSPEIEYDYIHGKINNFPNNMVLGIPEYLKGEERNTKIDFIEFKKYYQRIHKKTGCKYKKWIEDIKEKSLEAELYIFGHSLDVTDGDIIKELIMTPNIKTTIYYHTNQAYGEQITRLVQILGQDNLIEMVHGVKPKIIFKKQSEMVSINDVYQENNILV